MFINEAKPPFQHILLADLCSPPGNYLYIDTSSGTSGSKKGDESVLYSKELSVSRGYTVVLTFYYKVFGQTTGHLYIRVSEIQG